MATTTTSAVTREHAWPALPLNAWSGTAATLHMWLQIAGKIRTRCSPWTNHSWHTTFYVTSRGITTSPIPYGLLEFEILFDFIGHVLTIQVSDGRHARLPLEPQSVAAFYRRLMQEMRGLGLDVRIHPRPNEVPEAIPFAKNESL